MSWCEANRVDFLFGLARNSRLVGEIGAELAEVEAEARRTGKPARRFKDFSYSTLDSWSRRRRVVGKAEWTNGEANPRFVVTTLKPIEQGPRELYEDVYCARGDMENRIKESQADPVRRSHISGDLQGQPAAALVLLVRLCSRLRRAPHRPAPHPIRRRRRGHDPAEAVQDRRAGEGERTPDQVRAPHGLSLRQRMALGCLLPRPRRACLTRRRSAHKRGNPPQANRRPERNTQLPAQKAQRTRSRLQGTGRR